MDETRTSTPGRPPATTAPEHRARGGRRTFWVAAALLWLLSSAWALASPPASGPDENAHVVKAAAVVRGQLLGHSAPDNPGAGLVTVPLFYAELLAYPCFAFHPDVTADCAPELTEGAAGERPTDASTWVVRNNPLYYALVGLPTLLPAHDAAFYLVRLLSAALCSLVLAWGVREATTLRRPALPLLGVLGALTPMVVYLNSTVTSSALEISAAVSLWVALLALVRAPDPARLGVRLTAVAVLGVLFVNSRGLSPLLLALVVVSVAAVGPWREVVRVLADRRTWPALAAVAVGTVLALAWTLRAGTLEAGGATHPDLGFVPTAVRTFLDTGDFLLVALGRFGWLDTTVPTVFVLVLVAVVALPTVLGLALGTRRDRVALLGVAVGSVLVPVLVHAWQARNVGYIWTSRYSMPLYVGVVVVAGFVLRDARPAVPAWIARRVLTTAAVLLAGGQAVAFVYNLRRYTVGENGSWRQVLAGGWEPPLPGALLLLLVVATLVATVRAVGRVAAADVDGPPAPAAVGERARAGAADAERAVDPADGRPAEGRQADAAAL